jgi:hypothetical protein
VRDLVQSSIVSYDLARKIVMTATAIMHAKPARSWLETTSRKPASATSAVTFSQVIVIAAGF